LRVTLLVRRKFVWWKGGKREEKGRQVVSSRSADSGRRGKERGKKSRSPREGGGREKKEGKESTIVCSAALYLLGIERSKGSRA